jgi:16S rRNA (uracil1498-N3)-methyltransferase
VSGFRPRFFISQHGPLGDRGGAPSPADDLRGTEWSLGAEDSRHALRVLRLSQGDECEVVVGAAVYAATVSGDRSPMRVRLTARQEGPEAGACYRTQVGLAQALTRPALLDHVLEKATEVGASFFVLVHTAGSPRWSGSSLEDRLARWRRIILGAAKQSKQVAVPGVEVAGSIAEALATLEGSATLSLLLEPSAPKGIWDRLPLDGAPVARVALWVGPESGWTSGESAQLTGAGVGSVRLGQSTLRAETAGPVAVAVTRLLLRDW